MSPAALKALLVDLPGTFDLVDIRPPTQFADYSVPGSRNADVADVMDNPAFLAGAGPLIIVDRDGSLAMQVAGILSQKTQRAVKALHGGLEAYWAETELKGAVTPVPLAPAPSAVPAASPATPGAAQPGQAAPAKKRSAGC
jgi:rhodanese-related sulfurtransferase